MVSRTGSLGASGYLHCPPTRSSRSSGRAEPSGPTARAETAPQALRAVGIEPLGLASKGALALVDGTQLMAGIAAPLAIRSERSQ